MKTSYLGTHLNKKSSAFLRKDDISCRYIYNFIIYNINITFSS